MMLAARGLALLIWLSIVVPAFAGTVYIPLATDVDRGGHVFSTEVRLLNTSATDFESFRYWVIPAGTDGTERPDGEVGEEVLLAPGALFVLQDLVPFGTSALVEITAPDAVHISSRLTSDNVGGLQLLGHEMPVVSSDTLIPPDGTGVLMGWSRTEGDLRTDFHLVNLGFVTANCSATVYAATGQVLASNVVFSQEPLSLRTFADVLSLLGVTDRDGISGSFSCDQTFYPFSVTYSLATGEVRLIHPSASGRSTLQPPSSMDDPEPGAVVFELPGIFHSPTPGNESRRFNVPFPGNPTYSRIILEMDFTHGGWSADPSDNHGVFWLNRGTRWRSNMFGYLNIFGPGTNQLKLATNANLDAGDVQAKSVGAFFMPGGTYHVRYEYNILESFYEATVTRGDQVVGVVRDIPTVNQIRTVGENWFVDFGHNLEAAGPEVPTYGWTYSNLRVQWIP